MLQNIKVSLIAEFITDKEWQSAKILLFTIGYSPIL